MKISNKTVSSQAASQSSLVSVREWQTNVVAISAAATALATAVAAGAAVAYVAGSK